MKTCLTKRHNGEERAIHYCKSYILQFIIHIAKNDLAQLVFYTKLFKSNHIKDPIGSRICRI